MLEILLIIVLLPMAIGVVIAAICALAMVAFWAIAFIGDMLGVIFKPVFLALEALGDWFHGRRGDRDA